jgi:ABC-type bacteriocin/lantibiotic exporter with double-glycine peptidase domain
VKWLPEGLVILGSLFGGVSLFLQEWSGPKAPAAESIPDESGMAKDCGAIALYLICRIEGKPATFEEIRTLTKTSLTGTSMFDIKEAAEQQGFKSSGVKCSFESLWSHLSERGHYAILYFQEGHFAPAVRALEGKIRIIDTRRLEATDCSADDLNKMGWDETALLLIKTGRE